MKKRVYSALLALTFTSIFGIAIADSQVSTEDASSFIVQPYLYVHGSNSLNLGWRYADSKVVAKTPEVKIFNGEKLVKSVAAQFDGVSWTADLGLPECGVDSNTTYFVAGMSQHEKINRNPCPGQHQMVRFSFIADAQEGPEFLEDIAKEMAQFPGAAILSGGDLVQEGAKLQDWTDYFRALRSIGGSRVTIPVIGNHEYRSTPTTNYFQNFFRIQATDAYYSTYLGDLHLLVLNTNFEDDPSLIEKQLEWLKTELAKPSIWRVVMFHHSPYSMGFFDGPGAIKKEHLVLRDRYVPLFEAYRVDLVLSGHTHIFERSVKDGIQYLVAGPAGGKMGVYGAENPYSIHSFRKRTVSHFEVNETTLHSVTLSIDGEILDDFTLAH